MLQEVKRQLREQGVEQAAITLLSEPEIDYQTIVTAMDTVRSFKALVAASVVDAALFPEISFGAAPASGHQEGVAMSSSLRARRMARNHRRLAATGAGSTWWR